MVQPNKSNSQLKKLSGFNESKNTFKKVNIIENLLKNNHQKIVQRQQEIAKKKFRKNTVRKIEPPQSPLEADYFVQRKSTGVRLSHSE